MKQPVSFLATNVATRRRFCWQTSGLLLTMSLSSQWRQVNSAEPESSLIASIEKETVLRGRDGKGPTWFHPRACVVPDPKKPRVLMTLQTIGGSDYFGPVHSMTTHDLGRTWSEPQAVPPLGRVKQSDGAEEGVCDVVPEWHEPTKTVLAVGQNVFYRGPRFSADQPPRWPIYAVWKNGEWGPRGKLQWDDPRGAFIYANNCGQRVVLPNDHILLAFTYGAEKNKPRAVSSVVCFYNGETLAVKQVSEPIINQAGRGLLEPSLTKYGNRYFITLRADDNRGYVSASEDGLTWSPKQAWMWDDGEPLSMSTTQQHWLTHSDGLFLVYTRKDATNVNVMRWRSPLWLAQVDPQTLRLIKSTERVVLPLMGDGVHDPNRVAIMGNFHVTNVTREESWVTVGEWQPKNGIHGDMLLARVKWSKPNRLIE